VSFAIDPELAQARVEVAQALFGAWSSGDADAPRAHLAPDAVLFDIIGGEHRGWPAIRTYFQHGLDRYPDLVLAPTGDFWARPDGLAMLWVMSGTQTDDSLGADAVGRKWSAEGLSYLVFDGLTVVREADYHDKGSRERSLRALHA
jgi:SnoaL-like domain